MQIIKSYSLQYKAWPIILLPAIVALGFILHFSVDVPYEDEWMTPGALYQHIIEGTLGFQDFFYLHAESRDAFPRLIFVVVGLLVGWRVIILMLISWFCVLLTLFVLLKMLPGGSKQRLVMFIFIAGLLGGLLFSPAQWENQLWGIQLIVFIPPLCLAASLWLQTAQVSYGIKAMGCALLSILATFSYANGMSVWLLAFPLPMLWLAGEWQRATRRERIKTLWWTALYIGLAAATISFYFWDYQKPGGLSYSEILQNPGFGLQYFATWVGAPFVQYIIPDVMWTTIIGAGILVVTLASIGLVGLKWKQVAKTDILASAYPWVFLMAYGILAGLAVTAGRTIMGLESALVSAYTSFSLWVTIGLVGLLYTLWYYQKSESWNSSTKLFSGIIIGVISLLTVLSWFGGFKALQAASLSRQQELLTLRLLEVTPHNPLLYRNRIWLSPELIRERATLSMEHGILKIEPVGDWLTEKIKAPDGVKAGWFRVYSQDESGISLTPEEVIRGISPATKELRIEGWAMIPNQGVPADFVMLAATDYSGKVEPISGFIINTERPDVVEALDNPDLLLSGFNDALEPALVEGWQFKMFAVDLNHQRVYELLQDNGASEVIYYSFLNYLDSAKINSELEEAVPRQKVAFTINDEPRSVMFEHPNSEVVFEGVPIETEASLRFGLGINQAAWDQPGDGVLFELIVVDEKSAQHVILSQYIDPKNKVEDRKWVDNKINLDTFAGQRVSFIFKTSGGPQDNMAYDWAGWSSPQIVYQPQDQTVVEDMD